MDSPGAANQDSALRRMKLCWNARHKRWRRRSHHVVRERKGCVGREQLATRTYRLERGIDVDCAASAPGSLTVGCSWDRPRRHCVHRLMMPPGMKSAMRMTIRLKMTRLTSDVTVTRRASPTSRTSGAPISGPCQVPAPPITAMSTTLSEMSNDNVAVGSMY